MFSYNKLHGKEKEEKHVLLTQRLKDQNSLTYFQRKLHIKKKTSPKQAHNRNNGFHMEENV